MTTRYHVYVLRNTCGRFYVGISEDVANRLRQHNAGESKWIAKYRPWEPFWVSNQLTLSDARRLENLLKRQKGGDGFFRLLGVSRPSSSGS